jgi:hypothetical protein
MASDLEDGAIITFARGRLVATAHRSLAVASADPTAFCRSGRRDADDDRYMRNEMPVSMGGVAARLRVHTSTPRSGSRPEPPPPYSPCNTASSTSIGRPTDAPVDAPPSSCFRTSHTGAHP